MIVDPYMKRARSENYRYLSWQKQSSGQQGVVWQHWRALRRLLTSERGAWANRYENKPKENWPKTHSHKSIPEKTLFCQWPPRSVLLCVVPQRDCAVLFLSVLPGIYSIEFFLLLCLLTEFNRR